MDSICAIFIVMWKFCKREPGLWAVILLPLIYFYGELTGLCRFAGVDHTKLNMPLKFFDVLAMRHGELPLWNPYLFNGAPHLAEGESGTFYLLNMIDHLPGDFFYWYGLNIILHFIIMGVTCYALLRYKGAGTFAAAIFAMLFQLTPFAIYHLTAVALFQVLAWLPLLVLLFEMVLDGRAPLKNGFWVVGLTSQLICAGSQQMLFLGFMALAFLGIARAIISRDGRMALRGLIFIVAASIGGFLLAALQLMPSLQFNALSNRAVAMPPEFYSHGSWLNWQRLASLILFPAANFNEPNEAIGFASSQIYIGLIPLFLVIYAIYDRGIRRKASPYLWACLPLLILAFGWNLGLYHILTQFPPFSYFRYLGRTSVLFILFLAVPASLALGKIVDPKLRERRTVVNLFALTVLATAFLLGVFHLTGQRVSSLAVLLLEVNAVIFLAFVGLSLIRGRDIVYPSLVFTMLFIISLTAFTVIALLAIFFLTGQKAAPVIIPLLMINAVLLITFIVLSFIRARDLVYATCIFVILQLVTFYPFTRIMSLPRTDFDKSFAAIDTIVSDESIDLKRLMVGTDVWVVDPDALRQLSFGTRDWLVDSMGGCASTLKQVGCINVYLPLHEKKWKDLIYDRLFLNLRNSPTDIRPHSINACWLLGINYVLVNSPELGLPNFERMEGDTEYSFHKGAYLFHNTKSYQRYFLTRNIRRYRYYDERRFLMLLNEPTPKDEYGVVLPDTQDPPQFADRFEQVAGDVRMVRHGLNSYELEVTCDKDCYLIVRDDYYPGWEVRVDDTPSMLYCADYINRAVYIPQGVHRVEFAYRPASFRQGLYISVISMLVYIFVGLWIKRERNIL